MSVASCATRFWAYLFCFALSSLSLSIPPSLSLSFFECIPSSFSALCRLNFVFLSTTTKKPFHLIYDLQSFYLSLISHLFMWTSIYAEISSMPSSSNSIINTSIWTKHSRFCFHQILRYSFVLLLEFSY